MANDLSKYNLPNITNEALKKALSAGLLNFNSSGESKSSVIPPNETSTKITNKDASPNTQNGTSEVLAGTFRDLLPALFGVGAGIVGRKSGLSANDSLGLGITSLNAATSVQNTYRNNRQNYYNRVASKLVDDYVAKSGGAVDANTIYKALSEEHPDVFKNINPGEILEKKMAERNKVIDLSTKEFVSQAQKLDAYQTSKSIGFRSGSIIMSPDLNVGPNLNFHYANYDSMLNRLNEKWGGDDGEKKYFIDKNGKFSFKNPEDFDKFVKYIDGIKEKDPITGQEYAYDMSEVLKNFNQPQSSGDAYNNAKQRLVEANIELAKARKAEVDKRAAAYGQRRGAASKKTFKDMYDSVNRANLGDPEDQLRLADILFKLDTGAINSDEMFQLTKDILPKLKDSQNKPPSWIEELLKSKLGSGGSTDTQENKGSGYE